MKLYFLVPLFLQKLIWIPTRCILSYFGHLRVQGLEHVKTLKGPIIFASNHASEIDAFIVPSSLPFWSRFSPLFYVTRERAFYDRNGWRKYLFGGLFINAWGGYTAYTGLQDYEKSLADHIQIARDGGSFCVYPEGGITDTGALRPAKGGVAYLAERGDCTIIPVGISGTFRVSFANFFLGRCSITVRFGRPITAAHLRTVASDTSGLGSHVYKLRAQYVMDRVAGLLEKGVVSQKIEDMVPLEDLQREKIV